MRVELGPIRVTLYVTLFAFIFHVLHFIRNFFVITLNQSKSNSQQSHVARQTVGTFNGCGYGTEAQAWSRSRSRTCTQATSTPKRTEHTTRRSRRPKCKLVAKNFCAHQLRMLINRNSWEKSSSSSSSCGTLLALKVSSICLLWWNILGKTCQGS